MIYVFMIERKRHFIYIDKTEESYQIHFTITCTYLHVHVCLTDRN